MRVRYRWPVPLAIMVLALTATAAAQPPHGELADAEKVYGLSYFWKEVSYNFAFFDQVSDLDWDSAYQTFIPRVMATNSVYEYYRELQLFCALLRDGHTSINFPRFVSDSLTYPRLLLAEIDHRMYVRNVDSGLAESIPIGSEIIEIDGIPSIEYVRDSVMPYWSASAEHVLWDMSVRTALKGWKGTDVTIGYRTPAGDRASRRLTRDREGIRWYRALPDRPLMRFEWFDDGVAYLEFTSFNDTAIVGQFEAVLPELYRADGVIIDIRRNPGGNTSNGTDILEHFATDTLWGSTWRTPEHIAAFKAWGRHHYQQGTESDLVPYYTGDAWHEGEVWYIVPDSGEKIGAPVVVLFGRKTGSAAEDFLIFADKLEQFTYVGEPTNGSTGQPLFIEGLPGGGTARICSKRDTYPDGRDFVGYGVQPDVAVARTVTSLIDGSDPILDEGIEVLQARMGSR